MPDPKQEREASEQFVYFTAVRESWTHSRTRFFFLLGALLLVVIYAAMLILTLLPGLVPALQWCETVLIKSDERTGATRHVLDSLTTTCHPAEVSPTAWIVGAVVLALLLLPEILTIVPLKFEAFGVKAETGGSFPPINTDSLRESKDYSDRILNDEPAELPAGDQTGDPSHR